MFWCVCGWFVVVKNCCVLVVGVLLGLIVWIFLRVGLWFCWDGWWFRCVYVYRWWVCVWFGLDDGWWRCCWCWGNCRCWSWCCGRLGVIWFLVCWLLDGDWVWFMWLYGFVLVWCGYWCVVGGWFLCCFFWGYFCVVCVVGRDMDWCFWWWWFFCFWVWWWILLLIFCLLLVLFILDVNRCRLFWLDCYWFVLVG